jgi:hypothetical protein
MNDVGLDCGVASRLGILVGLLLGPRVRLRFDLGTARGRTGPIGRTVATFLTHWFPPRFSGLEHCPYSGWLKR